jgi:hypothetical protein
MNLKKLATDQLKKAVVKKAAGQILPMDSAKPKAGWKVKLAGILATIAAVAGFAAEYLGG